MANILLLFSSGFPYGNRETFLETEILYLSDSFDEVRIISAGKEVTPMRQLPGNVSVRHINVQISPQDKLNALFQRFNSTYEEERRFIRGKYKRNLSSGIIKTMLVSLRQAKKYQKVLIEELDKIQDTDNIIAYSYWCADAALGLAFERKINDRFRAVSRIHRWDVYFEESAINYLPFRTFITQHLDKVFSISQDGIDYAVREWNVSREKFVLSRLGTRNNLEPVQPSGCVFRLISCSNMIPVKRVRLIVDALKLLGNTKIEWVHFGDGSEWSVIEEEVKKIPFDVQVELKGRIPNSEIFKEYHTLAPNLFINVSSSEGVPVSIMEAMSFGIPVIATAVGGTPEIVNSRNGKLLAANPTATEVAEAIRSFVALHADELKAKQVAAYETWKNEYNAEKNYKEFAVAILAL